MTNEQHPTVFAPAVVVLSRWDYHREAPVVFPSRRNDAHEAVALLEEWEVQAEVAKYELLNLNAGERGYLTYQIDVVPPDQAQSFMDERADDLRRKATSASAGLLYPHGFSPEEMDGMGLPQRPEGVGEEL
jgi:hypothetical protein